jgi:threonine aldolase
MKTIDLRSDTVTRPTPGMLDAMMSAKVGDDVFEDDPTVQALESKAAKLFGVEASLFVASGTMGNQVSLYTHAHRGDELICDDEAHIDWYEVGGAAALSGLQVRPIPAPNGIPDPDAIKAAIRPPNIHHPVTGIIAVENTHNRAGGVVVPLDVMRKIAALAHDHGAKTHLDGARIWNAHAATGIALSEWAQGFDSVQVCLSKGMGAPVGSMILGKREFITRARRTRKMFGGGMRQVGILAAAGIWAIDNQLPKLADDHRRAKHLAASISDLPGVRLIPDPPPTNIVVIDLSERGDDTDKILAKLEARGILLVGFGASRIRAVTHRDVDDDDIEAAIVELKKVLK